MCGDFITGLSIYAFLSMVKFDFPEIEDEEFLAGTEIDLARRLSVSIVNPGAPFRDVISILGRVRRT